jgi:peroxiredoxin
MKTALFMLTAFAAAVPVSAQNPTLTQILNRVSVRYRNLDNLKMRSALVQTSEDAELTTDVFTHLRRPNQYLVELKGALTFTLLNDSKDVYAVRGDRKSYLKLKAPLRLMGADALAGQTLPAPLTKLVSLAVTGTLRDGATPISRSLLDARIERSGDGYTVLSFPWEDGSLAELSVSQNDSTLRKVVLRRGAKAVVTETVSELDYENPVPSELFTPKLSGYQMVATLPPLELPKIVKLKEAEDFSVEKPDGTKVRLKDLRGRTVLLVFWKSDIETMVEYAKLLSQFQRELNEKGLEILAVNTGDTAEVIEEFMKQNRLKFPVALNGSTEKDDAAKLYEVDEEPTSFIINPEGRIVAKVVGHDKGDRRVIDALKRVGIQ